MAAKQAAASRGASAGQKRKAQEIDPLDPTGK